MRTLLLVPIAVVTLSAAPGQPGREVGPVPNLPVADARAQTPAEAAIENGLAFLARAQSRNGSWPALGGVPFGLRNRDGDIAVTSLAVMAFLSAGHVPGEGRYGGVVDQGIRWVLGQQGRDGKLAPPQGSEMYHHGIATLMLAEAVGMTAGDLAEPLRTGLEKAVVVILTGQRRAPNRHAGGWRYQAAVPRGFGDSDLSVTGWQLMALRAAKNVGCDVPAANVQAAVNYVRGSIDVRTGGFQYQPGGMTTVPCTGVGVLCLELSGKEHHLSNESQRGGAFLLRDDRQLRPNETHFYYGVYYVSQALFQLGGNYWQIYRPKLHDLLLQHSPPNEDGAWGGRGGDAIYGAPYATAMAILALTVEYRFLPIYQRFEEPLERD